MTEGEASDDVSVHERHRLDVFAKYEFLIGIPNETLEEICLLARGLFQVAHAYVTLLGAERGYYLTHSLVGRESFLRSTSITRIVFEAPDVSIVRDVAEDPRFLDLTKSAHQTRFLGAVPLRISPDVSLGILSILDPNPRDLNDADRAHFRRLGALVVNEFKRQRGLLDLQAREALLVRARDEANAANAAKSAFLAAMSHEIRTPLNGVLGMAQAMAGDEMSAIQRDRLEILQQSGQTLLALLNDILDLSKIEAGKLELEDGEFDIGAVANLAHATFTTIASDKRLAFHLTVDPEAGGVYRGDPTRVRQILCNLISNALKFTARGDVHVSVSHDHGALLLSVADTGPGIRKETLARLFETFVQADASTTRRYGGTGLGLSICRQLSEMMGGTIDASSELGEGQYVSRQAATAKDCGNSPRCGRAGAAPEQHRPHARPRGGGQSHQSTRSRCASRAGGYRSDDCGGRQEGDRRLGGA